MADLFFRAETPAAMRNAVRSAPFRAVLGADPGDDLVSIMGRVEFAWFPPGAVVITPGTVDQETGEDIAAPVTDGWCWLHVRLHGEAEDDDDDPEGTAGPDRWYKSRLIRWVRENGAHRVLRGCEVWQVGTVGNRVQVWRASDMAANGVLFHEFLGGNVY